jgi:hypothetical protein
MINIKSYTCSECGATVKVTGILNPTITRSCSHDQAVVHANLEGTLFGLGALQNKMLSEGEIPEQHRVAFVQQKSHQAWQSPDGPRWPMSSWLEYIDAYHKSVLEEELARLEREMNLGG